MGGAGLEGGKAGKGGGGADMAYKQMFWITQALFTLYIIKYLYIVDM